MDGLQTAVWQKSLRCGSGACVEVANLPGDAVAIRNSTDPDGPVVRFTGEEWRTFIAGVRGGEFG